ncbi:MAG: hypothetical protein QOJ59_2818 [Thermomicrobiales bacterium]|jgi:hypothetical protein|nr:hypothetical protein [Thermomicrobiales bacterium]
MIRCSTTNCSSGRNKIVLKRLHPTQRSSDSAHAIPIQTWSVKNHARRSAQEPRIRAMLMLAQSETGIPIRPDDLDTDP